MNKIDKVIICALPLTILHIWAIYNDIHHYEYCSKSFFYSGSVWMCMLVLFINILFIKQPACRKGFCRLMYEDIGFFFTSLRLVNEFRLFLHILFADFIYFVLYIFLIFSKNLFSHNQLTVATPNSSQGLYSIIV